MSEKDPDRYAKGRRGDPGRLLREEKLRKRKTKEKPKLEIDLTKVIKKWEESQGRPFLVNGSRFLDDLAAKLGEEAAAKENTKRTRSGTVAATPARKRPPPDSTSKQSSPNKRVRSTSVTRLRSQAAEGGMRSSATPFGTQAQNGVDVAESRSSATRRPHHSSSKFQKTATERALDHRSAIQLKLSESSVSTDRSDFTASAMIIPQMTGNSVFNPVTPTPVHHGVPLPSSSSSMFGNLNSSSLSLSSSTQNNNKSNWQQLDQDRTTNLYSNELFQHLFGLAGKSHQQKKHDKLKMR